MIMLDNKPSGIASTSSEKSTPETKEKKDEDKKEDDEEEINIEDIPF